MLDGYRMVFCPTINGHEKVLGFWSFSLFQLRFTASDSERNSSLVGHMDEAMIVHLTDLATISNDHEGLLLHSRCGYKLKRASVKFVLQAADYASNSQKEAWMTRNKRYQCDHKSHEKYLQHVQASLLIVSFQWRSPWWKRSLQTETDGQPHERIEWFQQLSCARDKHEVNLVNEGAKSRSVDVSVRGAEN